jgi:hypothetical protein
MIDPASQPPERVPDTVMSTSAVFKSPNVIDLKACAPWLPGAGTHDPAYNGTANGETTVALFPGSNGGIWHTLGDEVVTINMGSALLSYEPAMVSSDSFDSDGWIRHALRIGDYGIIPRLKSATVNGREPIYEVQVSQGGPPMLLQWQFRTSDNLPRAGAAEGVITTYDVLGAVVDIVNVHITSNSFTVPLNFTGTFFSFSVQITDTQRHKDWSFSFGPGSRTSSLQDFIQNEFSSCSYKVDSANGLQALDQTQQERPCALSGLITYFGTDLANGGEIAASRMPMGTTPISAEGGDYYNYIASLPIYNRNHAMRDGAYVWWCPDSDQEYFYRKYNVPMSDDISTVSSLWVTFSRSDPVQAVRLQVVQNVEVLTRSILYTSEVAPSNAAFSQLLAVTKVLPAVTENPVHRSFLAGLLQKARKAISKPSNWMKLLQFGTKALLPYVKA